MASRGGCSAWVVSGGRLFLGTSLVAGSELTVGGNSLVSTGGAGHVPWAHDMCNARRLGEAKMGLWAAYSVLFILGQPLSWSPKKTD